MNDIEFKIFQMILSQLEVMIGFNRFGSEHEHITSRSLENYLYRNMRPTRKKYTYIIDCLKTYHAQEYELMKNNIENRYNKTIKEIIEEGTRELAVKNMSCIF
ncbi:MAG: hypothetical protein PHS97_01855 [Oscillospiraceae bacterium]|nr:hypothetical protein [Oscillospiraceae bacterium]